MPSNRATGSRYLTGRNRYVNCSTVRHTCPRLLVHADPVAPLVLAGHSHGLALGIPPRDVDGGVRVVPHPYHPRFACLTGDWPRNDRYWDHAVEISRSQPLGLVWNGNQHYYMFMFVEEMALDFALAARPDLPVDESAAIVPELLVRELVDASLTSLRSLLARMKDVGGPGVIVLGTPPPKTDTDLEALRYKLADVRPFADQVRRAGGDAAALRLTSASFHLKVWLLLQARMRALAEGLGMTFCGVPREVQTEEGFLGPGLWTDDLTHANKAYGRLMLEHTVRQLWPEPSQAEG